MLLNVNSGGGPRARVLEQGVTESCKKFIVTGLEEKPILCDSPCIRKYSLGNNVTHCDMKSCMGKQKDGSSSFMRESGSESGLCSLDYSDGFLGVYISKQN